MTISQLVELKQLCIRIFFLLFLWRVKQTTTTKMLLKGARWGGGGVQSPQPLFWIRLCFSFWERSRLLPLQAFALCDIKMAAARLAYDMITTSEFNCMRACKIACHGPVGPVEWGRFREENHLILSAIWKIKHELPLIKCAHTECTSHFLQSTCPVRFWRVLANIIFSRTQFKNGTVYGCEMPSHLPLFDRFLSENPFTIAGASRCLWENRQHAVHKTSARSVSISPLSQVRIHPILF